MPAMLATRREWLMGVVAAQAVAAGAAAAELGGKLQQLISAPVLRTERFREPVKIASVELLRSGAHSLVRVRSADGATGYSAAQGTVMDSTYPIFLKRVAPSFVGQDARQLEQLLTDVYLASSNYKWQGLAFWVPVAAIEIAVLDLLGQTAGVPLGELFGKVVRREINVYRASERRGNSAEAEIEYLQRLVAETGARAIKFRLGARMRYAGGKDAV